MIACILCGGKGTRVQSITSGSKALLEVGGRPFITHQLDLLQGYGVNKTFILASITSLDIPHTLGHKYKDINLMYSIEGSPLGTAGSIKAIEPFIDKGIFVVNGDTLFTGYIKDFFMHHSEPQMVVCKPPYPDIVYGEVLGKTYLKGFEDKENAKYINAGIYYFPKYFIKSWGDVTSLEHDVLSKFKHKIRLYRREETFYDIGTIHAYEDMRRAYDSNKDSLSCEPIWGMH